MYPNHIDFGGYQDSSQSHPSEQEQRVDFSIRRNGISLSASVTISYFESHVLPVISNLLEEVTKPGAPAAGTPKPNEWQPPKPPMPLRDIIERTAATTAPEIMKAAAVSLALIHGKPTFSRSELLDEVVKATGYWRKAHAYGVQQIIDYLIASGVLVEAASDVLSLNPIEEKKAFAVIGA